MEVIAAYGKALHQKEEPYETDANGTTDASKRETFTPPVFHYGVSLLRNGTVFGTVATLALAIFSRIVLLNI